MEKIVAYKLTRPDAGGSWMFMGTTPQQVANCIKDEIESNECMSAEECGKIIIEAYETTKEEIENLPEFPGW